MCIFLFTFNESFDEKYRAIFIHNRDEYFDRPSTTCIYDEINGVYGGLDLTHQDIKGKWLGISRKGRLAILLNIPTIKKSQGFQTRGKIIDEIIGVNNTPNSNFGDKLSAYSDLPFQVLYFKLFPNFNFDYYLNDPSSKSLINISNLKPGIYSFSNSKYLNTSLLSPLYNETNPTPKWKKLDNAKILFEDVLKSNYINSKLLLRALDNILKNRNKCLPDTIFEDEYRLDYNETEQAIFQKSSIFVDPFALNNRVYGTRCRTIILLDNKGNVEMCEHSIKSDYLKTFSISPSDLPQNILEEKFWETTMITFKIKDQ